MKTDAELPNLVLQVIGAGAWDWSIADNAIIGNQAFSDMLGLPPGRPFYVYNDWRALVHPDDLTIVEQTLAESVGTLAPYSATYRIRKPDGTLAWINGHGRVIETDDSGSATRMVGALRDVTDTMTLRETLQESESRFLDIVENLPGAILRYEVMPDGISRYTYLSPGVQSVFDLTIEAIQADPSRIRQMFSPEELEVFERHYIHQAHDPHPFDNTTVILTPAGRRKHLHIRSLPKRARDGRTIWTTLISDVTEQATLEADLERSRDMLLQARKAEAIGALSGGIAHDFNNLLTVIMGNLELLREDGHSGHRLQYIADAIDATQRGAALTRNMLSFARRAYLRPTTMNLNEVIQDMHAMLDRTLPANIALETALMGGLWPTEVDRSSVESAVLNLVINARDAMPTGGRLTVETANIRLSDEYVEERQETIPPGRYVMIAVTDTGQGIAADVLDHVFEPFFTTKAPTKGSGLGLPSVMGFTKQSGGTTRIYSEVGVGTSVKMYFRADTRAGAFEPRSPDIPEAEAEDGHHLRILLVEDEAQVRKVLRLHLEAEGFHVTQAVTGDEGYRTYLAQRPFDLVLTDIVMPGKLAGTDMIRALRKIDPGLRAVFISGYPTEAAIHGNGVRPEDVQLMKPVSRDDLMRALEKVLNAPPLW